MPAEMPPSTRPARGYWQQTRTLTCLLLSLWFGITFGSIWFARELASMTLFGWPVSFYMAAQGTALIYVAIIGLYAWRMRRLDHRIKPGSTNED